jgi:predicted transcriptional regulator
MKLAEYLEKNNLNAHSIAKKAELHWSSVAKVLEGKTDSYGSVLKKISLATNGKVSMDDLVNMEKVKKKAIRKTKTNLLPKSTESIAELPISIQT